MRVCIAMHGTVESLCFPHSNGVECPTSEVSSVQRLQCMREWCILAVGKGVLFREVSGVLIARGVPLWVRAKLRYLCMCHSSGYGCS